MKEKLIGELQKWNDLNKTGTENEIAKIISKSALTSSEAIDKYNSWILGLSGAIIMVLLTKVSLFFQTEGSGNIIVALTFLSSSLVFGFLSKHFGFINQTISIIETEMKTASEKVIDNFNEQVDEIGKISKEAEIEIKTDFDINSFGDKMTQLFPSFLKKWIKKKFTESVDNQLLSSKRNMDRYLLQLLFLELQLITLIGFIISTFVFIANHRIPN